MPTTDHNALIDAVTTWLKTAEPTLTQESVIPADEPGPRPTPPYISVRMVVYDNPLGATDVKYVGNGSPPVSRIRGAREDTVSLNAYGRGSGDLLRNAVLVLQQDDVRAALDTAGINVVPVGGMTNLSFLLDTDQEERWQRDVLIRYRVSSDNYTEAEVVSTPVTLQDWVAQAVSYNLFAS